MDLSKLEAVKSLDDEKKEREYSEAIAYLASTDWQVIAMYERQRQIPEDVQLKRQQAIDVVTSA